MVRTAEELVTALREMCPDNTGDAMIAFVGDLSDTVKGAENWVNEKRELEQRVTDTEAQWRQKFLDRFSGKTVEVPGESPNGTVQQDNMPRENTAPQTYEELFKEEG